MSLQTVVSKKKRIDWIDTAKGIGIFLVILGHITLGEGDKMLPYIYSFHMPLFIFLSGIVFSSKDNFKTFILKKIRSVYVPYAVFLVFEYLRYIIINRNNILYKDMFLFFIKQITGFELESNFYLWNGSIWFLCALFFSEIVFYFISKLKSVFIVISIFLGIIGSYFLHINLPFAISYIFPFVTFLSMGFLSKDLISYKLPKLIKNKIFYIIIFIILSTVLSFTSKRNVIIYMRGLLYGNIFIFIINSIIGIIEIISVSYVLQKIRFINYIGKNSIIILCFHLYFNRIFYPLIFKFLNADYLLGNSVFQVILSLFTVILMIPLIWFCNKYLFFIFGRKNNNSK